MFAAPFSRMLWKEYRSLRMLWFGCAVGTLGLWLLLYVVTVLGSDSLRAPVELMHAFWSLSLWLPAIYLLGCTVATFAGEKEERTAEWLINTAMPFPSTFAAKVIWPILSAGMMQAVLFGATALIREYFLATNHAAPLPADETLPELPRLATFALVEALAWGLFWSLQLSKPMPAAVLAAICIVLVNLATMNYRAGNVWEPYLAPWSGLRTVGVVVLFAVDLALARRWLAGRGWEWSIPWHRFVAHRQTSLAVPAVEQAVPWRRAWQRFRWLEWQGIRIFLIFTLLWALVAAIPMFFWPRQAGLGPIIISLFFLPLFAGLAAWQGEQSRFQFRFLANRGVPPYGLWLNKFGIWLATLIAAVIIVVTIGMLSQELGIAVILNHGNVSERINRAIQQTEPRSAFLAVCSYLTLYISAFTVSLYFRRSIFAFGAGLILHLALFFWCLATDWLNLPIWFGVLPLAAWLLWCGARHLPRWYLERAGWQWNAVIAAEWLVFPAVFAASVTSYWVYSVPLPNVELLLTTTARTVAVHGSPQDDAAWDDVRQKAGQLGARQEVLSLKSGSNPLEFLADDQWGTVENVRMLRDALLKPATMRGTTQFYAKSMSDGMGGVNSSLVTLRLMQLATREMAEGQVDDSITSIRAAVRYAGALHADAPLLFRSTEPHNTLHNALHNWARHPENSPEIMQRTLAELERHELRWWTTDPLRLESRYQTEMKELERIEHSLGFRRVFLKPWLARQRRMKAAELSNQLRFLRTPPAERGYAALAPGLNRYDPDPAWSYQSHTHPMYQSLSAAGLPVGLRGEVVNALWYRETQIRCTFAVMAAEAFRKQRGRLPQEMTEVVPQIASRELLTDPWSGALLQIRPQGVPGTFSNHTGVLRDLGPGTPFIWSVGPFGLQITEWRASSKSYQFVASRPLPFPANSAAYYAYPMPPDDKPSLPGHEPADALKPDGGQAELPSASGTLQTPDPFGAPPR